MTTTDIAVPLIVQNAKKKPIVSLAILSVVKGPFT